MKKVNSIFMIILLAIMAGCRGENKQSSNDYITVDVTRSYPKKELILQDFMDVEYIPLETTDDFLTLGIVMDIGKEFILVRNRIGDGDIFIYDRTGKGIRKINRLGQGGEEYIYFVRIILDENNSEIFFIDNESSKIMIYDLYGNFKRRFRFDEVVRYVDVSNFDDDHLIFYDSRYMFEEGFEYGHGHKPTYDMMSKKDGSITQKYQLPFKNTVSPVAYRPIGAIGVPIATPRSFYPIHLYHGNRIFVETSSDTIYNYSPNDHNLTPLIVRTPSIHSMNPEVFLFVSLLTDRYYFMETVKKEYDFVKREGFPCKDLVYDKQDKAIFEYTVYNDDYTDKKPVNIKIEPLSVEVAFWQKLESFELVEAYKSGKLKDGKLKEIASTLDPEDNPVIMLVKHKK